MVELGKSENIAESGDPMMIPVHSSLLKTHNKHTYIG